MAGHPRHLRVIEGADTDLIVCPQDAECRRDTADVRRVETPDSAAEQRDEDHPDPPLPSHLLTSKRPLLNNINGPGQPPSLVVADQVELFYSDRRKFSRSCFVASSSWSKCSITAFASEPALLWARIA